jgi:hypothetical protein
MAEITQINEVFSNGEEETIRFTCKILPNEISSINEENSRHLRNNEKYKPFEFKFNGGNILISVFKISYNPSDDVAEITGGIVK